MSKLKKAGVQITAEARSGVAYFRIVDVINTYSMASSAEVRSQVDLFLSQGIQQAEVYVSSRGGDVFEADDMATEFERFGKENVLIRTGAVCASAATIFLTKFKSVAQPNSQIMIHRPRLGVFGDIPAIEADLVLLKNKTADYKTAYAVKTGKSDEDIETLWSKGDVWLTAQQAREMGLIDEIEGSDALEVTAEDVTILEACGAPNIPEVTNQTIEPKMDRNLLISALGLPADATDAQIEAAAKKAKEAQNTLDAQVETEEDKKDKAAKKLVATLGIGQKRIKADVVAHYESWAKHDYEGCKAALEAMTPIPQLSAHLDTLTTKLEARADWTFEKWQDEDPKGLEAMADSDPDVFNSLFNKQYKK